MDEFEYARKYESSPIYRKANTATIAANSYFAVDFEVDEPNSMRYLPFNFLQVKNASTTNGALLYINGDLNTPISLIPAGTILTFDEFSLPAIKSIALKNVGTGTMSISDLEILAQKTAISTQKIAEDFHKKFFGIKNKGAR